MVRGNTRLNSFNDALYIFFSLVIFFLVAKGYLNIYTTSVELNVAIQQYESSFTLLECKLQELKDVTRLEILQTGSEEPSSVVVTGAQDLKKSKPTTLVAILSDVAIIGGLLFIGSILFVNLSQQYCKQRFIAEVLYHIKNNRQCSTSFTDVLKKEPSIGYMDLRELELYFDDISRKLYSPSGCLYHTLCRDDTSRAHVTCLVDNKDLISDLYEHIYKWGSTPNRGQVYEALLNAREVLVDVVKSISDLELKLDELYDIVVLLDQADKHLTVLTAVLGI